MGLDLINDVMNSSLPARLRALAMVLAKCDQNAGDGRRIVATRATLARWTGLSRETVKHQLADLRRLGIVEVIKPGRGRAPQGVLGFVAAALPKAATGPIPKNEAASGPDEEEMGPAAARNGAATGPHKVIKASKILKANKSKAPRERADALRAPAAGADPVAACPICGTESCADTLACAKARLPVIADLDAILGPLTAVSVERVHG